MHQPIELWSNLTIACLLVLAAGGFVVGLARVAWALTDAPFRAGLLPRLAGAVAVSVALGLVGRGGDTHEWIFAALAAAMAFGTLYAAGSEFRRGAAWWANWDPVVPEARGGGARNRWAFVVLVGIPWLSLPAYHWIRRIG